MNKPSAVSNDASQPAPRAAPLSVLERGIDRLEAIARGEHIDAVIHKAVYGEEPLLEIEKFSLWYGHKQALFDVTLPIPKGRVTAIIGPSGCGKSTLLRCVNRMNDLIEGVTTRGDMRLGGESIYAAGVDVIELRKRTGMVFQKPNPFPMSIFDNVAYPLMIDGERDRRIISAVCEQSLRGAALWDEVHARLHDSALSLSGGQQQRLCIARALAGPAPRMMLSNTYRPMTVRSRASRVSAVI
jgi:phosphate transport system ATP-binding protein